jgi:hypothetical protein
MFLGNEFCAGSLARIRRGETQGVTNGVEEAFTFRKHYSYWGVERPILFFVVIVEQQTINSF